MIDVVSNNFEALAKQLNTNSGKLVVSGSDKVIELEKRYVPIDTRALHDTIRAIVISDDEIDVVAGNLDEGVDYADYVEYGTYYSPAQPFVTPAAAQTRWAWYDQVAEGLFDG